MLKQVFLFWPARQSSCLPPLSRAGVCIRIVLNGMLMKGFAKRSRVTEITTSRKNDNGVTNDENSSWLKHQLLFIRNLMKSFVYANYDWNVNWKTPSCSILGILWHGWVNSISFAFSVAWCFSDRDQKLTSADGLIAWKEINELSQKVVSQNNPFSISIFVPFLEFLHHNEHVAFKFTMKVNISPHHHQDFYEISMFKL